MSCASGIVASRSSAKRQKMVEGLDPEDRRAMEAVVPRHIRSYFGDADLPEGVDLEDPKWVDLCIRTGICDAVDMAYAAMAKTGRYRTRDNCLDDDVLLVVSILRCIRRSCVPQEFSAGILLMHLELLEGLSFSSETSPSSPTS